MGGGRVWHNLRARRHRLVTRRGRSLTKRGGKDREIDHKQRHVLWSYNIEPMSWLYMAGQPVRQAADIFHLSLWHHTEQERQHRADRQTDSYRTDGKVLGQIESALPDQQIRWNGPNGTLFGK